MHIYIWQLFQFSTKEVSTRAKFNFQTHTYQTQSVCKYQGCQTSRSQLRGIYVDGSMIAQQLLLCLCEVSAMAGLLFRLSLG
ncbi:hypothetical protein EB796_025257 [Bugula neritina]|uniref:Uncharacterized protein n=1 Tax=Bugula neritina TaxID=10212 RepID=A0A7J7IR71_BUGNE|nr:hypothetical protein EB796_025257 [Bugula neritina]